MSAPEEILVFSSSSSEEEVGVGMSTRRVSRVKLKQRVKTRKKKKKGRDKRKSLPITIVEGVTPTSVAKKYTEVDLYNVVARDVTKESVVYCACKKPFTMLGIGPHLSRTCTLSFDAETIKGRLEKAVITKQSYRKTGLGMAQTYKDNYLARFKKRNPEPEKYSSSLDVRCLDSCWFKTKDDLKEYAVEDPFQKVPFFCIGRFTAFNAATHLYSLRMIADWMCDKSPMKVRLSRATIPHDCRDWSYGDVGTLKFMFHPDRLYKNFKIATYPDMNVDALKEVSTWMFAEFNEKKQALDRMWDVVDEDGAVPEDENNAYGNTFAIDETMPLFNNFERRCIQEYKERNVSIEWLRWNEQFIKCRKEIASKSIEIVATHASEANNALSDKAKKKKARFVLSDNESDDMMKEKMGASDSLANPSGISLAQSYPNSEGWTKQNSDSHSKQFAKQYGVEEDETEGLWHDSD